MKNMIRLTILAIVCHAFLLFGGCTKQADLYHMGLTVTGVMDEMVKSDDYFYLTMDQESLKPYRDDFIANDYDSPTRVLTITVPSTEAMLNELGMNDDGKYDNLSDSLKQQISAAYSLLGIVSLLNATGDTNHFIIINNYVAHLNFEGYSLAQPTAYLYLFETGTPIFVLFTPDGDSVKADGVFYYPEETVTLSSVREQFEPFGCTVNQLLV